MRATFRGDDVSAIAFVHRFETRRSQVPRGGETLGLWITFLARTKRRVGESDESDERNKRLERGTLGLDERA